MGRPAWTRFHRLAHTVLVLSLLHGSYFLFIHFTKSFRMAPPPNLDWLRIPFLVAGLTVIALHILAFGGAQPAQDPALAVGRNESRRRRS